MFITLKKCLSGLMQFFEFMSNTLKISMGNSFHSPHIKESKKYILCNNFIKKDLKLRIKNQKKYVSHP